MNLKAVLTDGSTRDVENHRLDQWVHDGLLVADTVIIDKANNLKFRAGDMHPFKSALAKYHASLPPPRPSGPPPAEKKCPFCAETIKWEAKVCRYCGRDLPMMGENPQASQQIDNTVFWTMAFMPLISLFVQQCLAGPIGVKVNDLWWVALLLNVLFIAVDFDKVKKAGFKTDSLAAAAILLFPVYMFMRGERTKAGPAAGIVWIFMFLASIVWAMGIGVGEALQQAPPAAGG